MDDQQQLIDELATTRRERDQLREQLETQGTQLKKINENLKGVETDMLDAFITIAATPEDIAKSLDLRSRTLDEREEALNERERALVVRETADS